MFSKIFKKAGSSADAAPAPAPGKPAVDPAVPETAAPAARAARAVWEARLQAAMGDDSALLALATEAPYVDLKHAAVLALASEEALKSAEREFRSHDRRVYRAAKDRYRALAEQRAARERANALIEAAAALTKEAMIPANRLVELDQAWRALAVETLEEAQRARFAELQAELKDLLRERGDQQIALSRWLAEARQALARLHASCAAAAAGTREPRELTAAGEAARAVLATLPAVAAAASLGEALQAGLEKSALVEARLALLAELEQAAPEATAEAPEPADARWQALPPLSEAALAAVLDARFAAWQQRQADARKARELESRQRAGEKSKAAQKVRGEALAGLVQLAETALAEGQLAETHKHLLALDEALAGGQAGGALQTRIATLQAEYARLKGWQHWGGGRARDDLVREAEALAKLGAVAEAKGIAKFPLKQHADAIEQLRAAWKELDRLGGATSRALWQRFDAALKTAYLPVAAQQNKLKAAREQNLAAREALIATLAAVKLEAEDGAAAPDWRELARALEHFQAEWRKLGPAEHTVPHKARPALLERMDAAVARLETPLREARQAARREREDLISRARALSEDAQSRHIVARVRELQAEWQQQAKALPLARKDENALWGEFKAATDAVFNQRDAAASARDLEFKANQERREALIARLGELTPDTPPADIERTLAAVDGEWRQAGEAPRHEAAGLEARYRAAREAALQHRANRAQRLWRGTCDNLSAKLALCEALEAGAAAAEIDARWSALPELPPAWERALETRRQAASGAPAETLDAFLLQLEAALDLASPAAFQAARRELKLRALKNAMEARQSTSLSRADVEKLVAAALAQRPAEPLQRQRLEAIVAALREGGPAGGRG